MYEGYKPIDFEEYHKHNPNNIAAGARFFCSKGWLVYDNTIITGDKRSIDLLLVHPATRDKMYVEVAHKPGWENKWPDNYPYVTWEKRREIYFPLELPTYFFCFNLNYDQGLICAKEDLQRAFREYGNKYFWSKPKNRGGQKEPFFPVKREWCEHLIIPTEDEMIPQPTEEEGRILYVKKQS